MSIIEIFKRLSAEGRYFPEEHGSFDTEITLSALERKYDCSLPPHYKEHLRRYPFGIFFTGGIIIKVEGAIISVNGDNTVDFDCLTYCTGDGPATIIKETDAFRSDVTYNNGWFDNQIVIGLSSTEHPFTMQIAGSDKGAIYYFDMWRADADGTPRNAIYKLANSFEDFVLSWDLSARVY